MPELPEVETIVRTLLPMVLGKKICAVQVLNPGSVDGGENLALLVGGSIVGIRRRGKLLLADVDGVAPLIGFAVHLKMTGRLFVYPQNTSSGPHTRVILDLDDGQRLFFDDARKFGYVRALSEIGFRNWSFWNKLGPEPLELPPAAFVNLFTGRRAAMKGLLLDQQILAGVGNIYADESLFRAGIHPRTKAVDLSCAQLEALCGHLKAVLEESIRDCGSSIKDYRTARGDAGAFQNKFRVYGRGGKPCITCGSALASQTIAGRTTIFCPHCQPE